MTKHQKEIQRKKMMWVGLWSMVGVMFSIITLTAYDKSVGDLGAIAIAFFPALSGFIASSFFSRPSEGTED